LIVADGLSRLSEDYRTVLMLRHLEGLSFTDIAAQMGRSVDSVEKLWVRGLAKLKRACAEKDEHGQH
jgi:RNA polymerase sigma-70 factor (ECF subfamily)